MNFIFIYLFGTNRFRVSVSWRIPLAASEQLECRATSTSTSTLESSQDRFRTTSGPLRDRLGHHFGAIRFPLVLWRVVWALSGWLCMPRSTKKSETHLEFKAIQQAASRSRMTTGKPGGVAAAAAARTIFIDAYRLDRVEMTFGTSRMYWRSNPSLPIDVDLYQDTENDSQIICFKQLVTCSRRKNYSSLMLHESRNKCLTWIELLLKSWLRCRWISHEPVMLTVALSHFMRAYMQIFPQQIGFYSNQVETDVVETRVQLMSLIVERANVYLHLACFSFKSTWTLVWPLV